MDGVDFIKKYDHENCVFYVDPPYPSETRSAPTTYGEFEMSREDHEKLLKTLAGIKGKFLLSSYPNVLYEEYASRNGWGRVDLPAHNRASSKKEKEKTVERVYMNYE